MAAFGERLRQRSPERVSKLVWLWQWLARWHDLAKKGHLAKWLIYELYIFFFFQLIKFGFIGLAETRNSCFRKKKKTNFGYGGFLYWIFWWSKKTPRVDWQSTKPLDG